MSARKNPSWRSRRRSPNGLALSVLCILIACTGCGDDGNRYPSRDWNGRYAISVSDPATDCYEATAPPPLKSFIMTLEHRKNNQATVTMNPLIHLEGEFHGDQLVATHVVQEPVALPDSVLARASAADSIETISYRLEADFSRNGFVARYVIRAPDLRALVREGEGGRCEFRYRLAGQRIREAVENKPAEGVLSPGGRAGRR